MVVLPLGIGCIEGMKRVAAAAVTHDEQNRAEQNAAELSMQTRLSNYKITVLQTNATLTNPQPTPTSCRQQKQQQQNVAFPLLNAAGTCHCIDKQLLAQAVP